MRIHVDEMMTRRIYLNPHAKLSRDGEVCRIGSCDSRMLEVVVVSCCVGAIMDIAAPTDGIHSQDLLAVCAEVLAAERAGQVRASIY
jgi:hypothetical protein